MFDEYLPKECSKTDIFCLNKAGTATLGCQKVMNIICQKSGGRLTYSV